MNYLGNLSNAVRTALLSATNVIPSDAMYRTDDEPKLGGGDVSFEGPYTGPDNITIDVEIADNIISGTPRVSAPRFRGVGNGTLTNLAATGALNAQSVTVTLEDLGTATTQAEAPFDGVVLQAVPIGALGNGITVTVNQSGLVFENTEFALRQDIRVGTNEYYGDEMNFGAALLNGDGSVPVTAPRIAFGSDPQVYRAYMRYDAIQRRFVYGFSPSPVRDVGRGARVRAVSGTRSIEIRQGATVENYTGIVTRYDALTAIRADSALVRVIGVITNDMQPGGQGATDLSVYTQPYADSIVAEGSEAIRVADIGLVVGVNAPTEVLTARCTDASVPGQPKFQLRGNVSGLLGDAIPGVPMVTDNYQLMIPLPPQAPEGSGATISVDFIPVDRGAEVAPPTMCPVDIRLGPAARNGKHTFVFRIRPKDGCDCTLGDLDGGLSDECLGITTGGSNVSVDNLRRYRDIRIGRWFTSLMQAVATYRTHPAGSTQDRLAGEMNSLLPDVREIAVDAVKRICDAYATTPPTKWSAAKTIANGDIIAPTDRDGFLYLAGGGGTTGATPPAFPANIGETVTDNGITWTCFSRDSIGAYDDAFAKLKSELISLMPAAHGEWVASTEYTLHDKPTTIVPPTRNKHYYKLVKPGTTGASQPTWPTNGSKVTDGTAVWQDMGEYWTAGAKVAEGEIVFPRGGAFEATTGGTCHASTEPTWDADRIVDGSVVWTRIAVDDAPLIVLGTEEEVAEWAAQRASYLETLRTFFAEAFSIGGVTANFNSASSQGSACWRDHKGRGWFVFDGEERRMPIQPGHPYHSAIAQQGPDGRDIIVPTREYGLAMKFGCQEQLADGDLIVVNIAGANGAISDYQEGDAVTASITHVGPRVTAGGQTGNDTLTFSVIGTDVGALLPYALVTTSPSAYSNGGLSFLVTPGAIPFQIGDRWDFEIEGGHFKWRRNGGIWSSLVAIAPTVAIGDGLVAVFSPGTAPSWVTGDRWSFAIEATNGIDNLRQPTSSRMAWTGSTTIVVEPVGVTNAPTALLLADHTIPADATITLQGSNTNFSTTPLNVILPWRATHLYATLPTGHPLYAKYRVLVNRGGSAVWLWIDDPLIPRIQVTDAPERGNLVKSRRLPGLRSRAAVSAQVEHSGLSQESVDEFVAMIEHACTYDDRRFAIVPNPAEGIASLVEFNGDAIDVTDVLDHQPRDTSKRLLALRLQLDAVP